jgi:single-stranded-DNA-specific exonuclease
MREILTRSFDPAAYDGLVARHIDPRMAKLYAGRGVSDTFALNTKLDALLAPNLLAHIEDAARYLADAIAAKRRMLIVADYDADGAAACAVGIRALRQMGAIVDFIVPNRFTLGYGLTPEVVDLALTHHAGKPDIIITVDNGIASVDGVARANQQGIDVVVTDHHLPGSSLPEAAVIVNPNQPGDTFPSKGLAGVGVMFYTMLALRVELRRRGAFTGVGTMAGGEPNLADLLDLVALGTVADVVKLEHNNRILVEQGLQRIRAGRACKGIAALLAVGGRDASRASTYDLGFVLGPRVNAAGRLEDMSVGIACLLTDNTATATRLAAELDHLNRTRRVIEADMKVGAVAALESIDIHNRYALALFEPGWHQGVVGILAGRIREQTHRPVIAFAQDSTGGLKGSGRSIPALHMRDALDLIAKRHPTLIEKFGGHAMAAGLTIRESALPAFAAAFDAVARELLTPTDLQERIETDGNLAAGELDFDFVQALEAQVWGQGFVPPSYVGGFKLLEQRVVGEKHLKLKLSLGGTTFEAMRFGSPDALPASFDAVYKPSVNTFRGNSVVQLMLDHVA